MNIKQTIKQIILKALTKNNIIVDIDNICIEKPKSNINGDYSTNIAMQLVKKLNSNPREIANNIINSIEDNEIINKVEIAGAGFINFYLNKKYLLENINNIILSDENYGKSNIGNNKKVNVEYVSANPTGILHLGHARGASYGDSLCRILSFAGFDVTREYYINDAGNQINNLEISIKERYKGLCGKEEIMPEGGYYGKEIIDIAQGIYNEYKTTLLDSETNIFREKGLEILLNNIKKDLENFRVSFDIWSSEQSIYNAGKVEQALEKIRSLDKTYEQDGALWLKTSLYGDEKDRVLIKNDGSYTYFLPDIAYHLDKLNRGYDQLIDVLGADHHGYVPRIKAAIECLGYEKEKLDVEIIQMVRLVKGNEEIKMSKRTGNAITINDLVSEVGLDATRYFFAMRSLNTQMDFDMELATKKSNENPVYYVQYAHARICSILKEAENKNIAFSEKFDTINSETAYNVLNKLYDFDEVVATSALKREPHLITNYVHEVATLFHSYYAQEKILTDDIEYSSERLALVKAVKIIIKNALNLIGVEALEKM
jgi:arginyl-tRNA synthetase